MTSFRADRWRPTVALAVALGTAAVCLVIGVVGRRADLVAVAVPFVLGIVVPLLGARVGGRDDLELRVPDAAIWEGDLAQAQAVVGGDTVLDLAQVAVEHDPGVAVEAPGTLQCVLPRPDVPAVVELPVRALHWGRPVLGPVTVTLTAAHGQLRRDGRVVRSVALTVVPLRSVFEATDVVPRASGLVGAHRSRQPGSGTDLHTIRPFLPGDRLRRITWPVSLRTGTLHVTTTTEDRDTDVQLVVDAPHEIGDPFGPEGTSLDITVRAAASIAEHYLHQGDRVGLIELGSPRRPVRLGAGRRQMMPIVAGLLGAGTSTLHPDVGSVTRRLHEIPPRALVLVFSTLLDEQIEHHLATLAQAGHALLVIDALPSRTPVPRDNDWTPLAWRLALIRRDTLRDRLAEFGVPVVPWRGAGSLDQVLLRLSRAAAVPRRAR